MGIEFSNGFVVTPIPYVEPSPTPTMTVTPSITPTITPTLTVTPTITLTVTPTETVTPTAAPPTPSITPTNTVTPTVTQTPTISVTPTNTITPTISVTPTITLSNTVTPTPSITPSISLSPTITPTNTITPTISLTPTNTITPTNTVTPTISVTTTITPTNTITPTITPTNTITPTITPTTPNNLILYYDPSNPASYPGTGTIITDLSGNGRNGTMSNISFTSPYFTYNGSSSQISIADNALLEAGTGDWTMEVWVNQSVAGNDVVLGKFDPGGLASDVSYSIRTTSTTYYAQLGSGTGSGSTLYVNSTNHTGTLNTWYHIVYVFTNVAANTLETFVNGSSVGSVGHNLPSLLNTTANLYIGSYNNGEYAQWFDGKIGITRLYNKALTASEVLNNYNNDVSKYIPATPTPTPTISLAPTITVTPTNTITPTISVTPTNTITPTISVTPTKTVTPTITPTVTITPTNSITPTITVTPTITPSNASVGGNTFSLATTSVTPLSGTTLSYYTDNSLTGLLYGGLNVGLNASITKIWSYGTYSSRTYAPATTVLMARPRTGYPYSNNWESTWWLSDTTGVANDGLLVEFNTTKTFTSISVGNPQELYASNRGSLQVWLVTGMSGNTMTSATLLGTVALSTSTTMATLNVSATGNLLWFRRTGSTSWSRLERIQINGS